MAINADKLREITEKADPVGKQITDIEEAMLSAAKDGKLSILFSEKIFEGTMQKLKDMGLHTKTTQIGYAYSTQISWEKENPFK